MPIHRKNKTYSKRMNGGVGEDKFSNFPSSSPPDNTIGLIYIPDIVPKKGETLDKNNSIYTNPYIRLFGGAIIIIVIFIIIYAIMHGRY